MKNVAKILTAVILIALLVSANQMIAQTWTSLNGPQIATNIKDISVVQIGTNAGNVWYTAENNYVQKSTNGGTAWFVTGNPYMAPSVVLVKPDDATKVIVAKNGELRYSADGGGPSEWQPKITDPNLIPTRLVAAVNDPTKMVLGRSYNATGTITIWWSQNGGSNWTPVPGFNAPTDVNDFSAIPNNTSGWPSGTIWACGSAPPPSGQPQGTTPQSISSNAGLWKSDDYGQTWTAYGHGNKNLQSITVVPRNSPTDNHLYFAQIIIGGNDILWKDINRSNPDLAQNIFSGVAEIRMVRFNNNNNTIFLATNDGVYRSTNAATTDGGGTWTKMAGLTDLDVKAVAVSGANTVFAATANSLHKSTNNGDTWVEVGKMNVNTHTLSR